MSMMLSRRVPVFHRRPFTKPDDETVFQDIGPTHIAIPDRGSVAQAEELLTAQTEEFVSMFDPSVDVQAGDVFSEEDRKVVYEVRAVRRFATGKLNNTYAEMDLERIEVPSLFPDPLELVTTFISQTFIATVGQTAFVLNVPTALFGAAFLFVNGVTYPRIISFDVVGTALTWKDIPFTLSAGDKVLVKYQVA